MKTVKKSSAIKRYNLALPADLFDVLQHIADERQTTVVDILRRFIKLGIMAVEAEETEGSALIIREGNTEREIVLL